MLDGAVEFAVGRFPPHIPVLAMQLDEAVRDIEMRCFLDGPQGKILLVLNKVEDERAMHDKLTAQFRASLDLQEVEALCLRFFVRGEGPTRRNFVGCHARRCRWTTLDVTRLCT